MKKVTTTPPEEEPTPSIPQQPLPPIFVRLEDLSSERKRYIINPPFQRKHVWGVKMEQQAIDTILLGDPLNPPEGYTEYDEKGKKAIVIIDGQQRIRAILRFKDGEFRTWTPLEKRRVEPDSELPVEPGKSFEQLSVNARNHFLDYQLQINLVRKRSDQAVTTRFLRVQNHIALSPGEKLNAYQSKANIAARLIEKHSFWEDFYVGEAKREQIFLGSLHVLAIQLSAPQGIVDLNSGSFLQGLAIGRHDKAITDAFVEAILARLDVVAHVFLGIRTTSRSAIIPMYQSVMFLEQAGYTFQTKKDRGRLTDWMNGLIIASNHTLGTNPYNRPIPHLIRESAQKAFWTKHRTLVMTLFGLNEAA